MSISLAIKILKRLDLWLSINSFTRTTEKGGLTVLYCIHRYCQVNIFNKSVAPCHGQELKLSCNYALQFFWWILCSPIEKKYPVRLSHWMFLSYLMYSTHLFHPILWEGTLIHYMKQSYKINVCIWGSRGYAFCLIPSFFSWGHATSQSLEWTKSIVKIFKSIDLLLLLII